LFLANLAFTDGQFVESTTLGIILGSVLPGVLGYLTLLIASRTTSTSFD